ncbi:hypothetical protein MHYP_G00221180 [Metynnis hypsauchen]
MTGSLWDLQRCRCFKTRCSVDKTLEDLTAGFDPTGGAGESGASVLLRSTIGFMLCLMKEMEWDRPENSGELARGEGIQSMLPYRQDKFIPCSAKAGGNLQKELRGINKDFGKLILSREGPDPSAVCAADKGPMLMEQLFETRW